MELEDQEWKTLESVVIVGSENWENLYASVLVDISEERDKISRSFQLTSEETIYIKVEDIVKYVFFFAGKGRFLL